MVLSLDLRQFRAAFFTQTVAPCRVELSDDEGDDDVEGKNENYICTLLDEDGWECGQRWPTARSARCTSTSHTGENAWRTKGSGKPGGHKSVFLVRIDSCQHGDNLKTYGSCRKHNRCVVDAGRFHYPVIDIPPDTICPRCDLIFNDTAELQRHLASMEYSASRGSFISDQCRNLCRCLWKAISGKRSATDGEPEGQKGRRKHIKQQPGGTKDDVTMGGMSSGQKGTANKSTDAKLHNAVLKTLCVLSQQVREVRGAVFMCWMIKQEAPEYKKPKEQLRAYSELAATKGKGHGLGPPGIAAFTGLLQALSERGSTVGAANAAGVANLKQTWDDLERRGLSIWYLIASWPKCTTQL